MASASAGLGLQVKPTPLIDLEAGPQVLPSGTIVYNDRASFTKGSAKIHPGGTTAEVELTAKPTDNDTTNVDDKTVVGGGGGDQTKVDEKKEEEKKEDKSGEDKDKDTKEEDPEAKKKAEDEKAAEEKKKKEDDEKKKKKEDEEKKKKEEKASFLRVVRNGAIGAAFFVTFYVFLLQMAIKQTLSAAEAPVSRGRYQHLHHPIHKLYHYTR